MGICGNHAISLSGARDPVVGNGSDIGVGSAGRVAVAALVCVCSPDQFLGCCARLGAALWRDAGECICETYALHVAYLFFPDPDGSVGTGVPAALTMENTIRRQ